MCAHLAPTLRQDFKPNIHISQSDFVTMTMNGTLCDADGCLGIE
jgi:hypothetical protein